MRKLIAMTGAAVALVLLTGDQARAETWQRQWTGPYGVDRSATVHCGPYGCGYNMQATGPNGASWSGRRLGRALSRVQLSFGDRARR
jgi:hypothetical protein